MNKENNGFNGDLTLLQQEVIHLKKQLSSGHEAVNRTKLQLKDMNHRLQLKEEQFTKNFRGDMRRFQEEFQRKVSIHRGYNDNLMQRIGRLRKDNENSRKVLGKLEQKVQKLEKITGITSRGYSKSFQFGIF